MTTLPADHFAVINLTYTDILGGVQVKCYTNHPAHLWLRWTDVIPQKHIIPREERGGLVNVFVDQCFVAYHDVEQLEPGDTFVHTFNIADWSYCQTRWFYFWATINAVLSPSRTCLFQYHSHSTRRYCYTTPAGTFYGSRSACAVVTFAFRPGMTYTLTHWKTHLARYYSAPPQNTWEIFIFSADPTGMPLLLLGQGSITGFLLPSFPNWLDVDFPMTPTPLVQGQNYAIGWRVSIDYKRDGASNRLSQDGGLNGNCNWPTLPPPRFAIAPGWQPDFTCLPPPSLGLWTPLLPAGPQYFEAFGIPTP